MKVAFQGERGAYSEEAARGYWKDDSQLDVLSCASFRRVFEAVQTGQVALGIIPIENSTAGSITENYDLLQENSLHIVGEFLLRVRHCLLALKGTDRSTLKRVISHPQALMQCDGFLRRHHLEPVAEYDTAGSAKIVADKRPPHTAAIASKTAGTIYDLDVLEEGIESNLNNYTRFLVISPKPQPRTAHAKTSLVLGAANSPGALHRVLGVFATRAINVTKIESRPSRKVPWEYLFYLDFDGHAEDETVADALIELRRLTAHLRILGSYPAFISADR